MATLKLRLVTLLASEQHATAKQVPLDADWAAWNQGMLTNPGHLPMTQVQEVHAKVIAAFWKTSGPVSVFQQARRPQGVPFQGADQEVLQLVSGAMGNVELSPINPLHCCCGNACVQYSEISGSRGLMYEVKKIDGLDVAVLSTRSAPQDPGVTLTGRTRYVIAACIE